MDTFNFHSYFSPATPDYRVSEPVALQQPITVSWLQVFIAVHLESTEKSVKCESVRLRKHSVRKCPVYMFWIAVVSECVSWITQPMSWAKKPEDADPLLEGQIHSFKRIVSRDFLPVFFCDCTYLVHWFIYSSWFESFNFEFTEIFEIKYHSAQWPTVQNKLFSMLGWISSMDRPSV